MHARTTPALIAFAMLGACVSNPKNPDDPYEDFNRQMYAFNDGLDKTVLEPVARGYRVVTNEPIRQGVTNFVGNLGEPVTFANEVLQGKLANAGGTVGRFVINTTIGIAGIFDPAGALGIAHTKEDFGQTLGVWGVKDGGPYLVLPVLGSTNPRDLTGVGIDWLINPINSADYRSKDYWQGGSMALGALSARESALDAVDDIRTTQVDPYTTLRRFYVRSRADAIANASIPPLNDEKVPDYERNF